MRNPDVVSVVESVAAKDVSVDGIYKIYIFQNGSRKKS